MTTSDEDPGVRPADDPCDPAAHFIAPDPRPRGPRPAFDWRTANAPGPRRKGGGHSADGRRKGGNNRS